MMTDDVYEFMRKNAELRRDVSEDQDRIDCVSRRLRKNTEINNFSLLIETAMRRKQRKENA